MNTGIKNMDTFKFGLLIGWLLIILIAVLFFRYIKDGIVFMLTKFYEYFIQHKI